jgi:hypothetical protein
MPSIIVTHRSSEEQRSIAIRLAPYFIGRSRLEWRGCVPFPRSGAYWQALEEGGILAVAICTPVEAALAIGHARQVGAVPPLVISADGGCFGHGSLSWGEDGGPIIRIMREERWVAAISYEVEDARDGEEMPPMRWSSPPDFESDPSFKAIAAVADVRDPYPYLR